MKLKKNKWEKKANQCTWNSGLFITKFYKIQNEIIDIAFEFVKLSVPKISPTKSKAKILRELQHQDLTVFDDESMFKGVQCDEKYFSLICYLDSRHYSIFTEFSKSCFKSSVALLKSISEFL